MQPDMGWPADPEQAAYPRLTARPGQAASTPAESTRIPGPMVDDTVTLRM